MFCVSRCMGLVTPDPGAAALFYASVFEMRLEDDDCLHLVSGPLSLFIDPGQPRPLVFELLTDDLGEARRALRGFGFEELVWRGRGNSNLVRDPFGLVWNIHEDRTHHFSVELTPPEEGVVRDCIGALTSSPEDMADFYSRVLDQPSSRLPGGAFLLDSGALKLRFDRGPLSRPVVWLRPDAPLDRMECSGCTLDGNGLLYDPYGMVWCAGSMVPAPLAAVCPL